MNATENLDIYQCRTCYNATKGLEPLMNPTKCGVSGKQQKKSFAQLLNEISGINVMDDFNMELPQYICYGCIRKLKMAHAFVQQAQDVNTRLIKIVLNRNETEAYKESDCLQEVEVDVQSCLEIKMEPIEEVNQDLPEEHSIVEIKLEEMKIGRKKDVKQQVKVTEVIHLLENRKSVREIAKMFGLSHTTVQRLKTKFGIKTSSSQIGRPTKIDEQTGRQLANLVMSDHNITLDEAVRRLKINVSACTARRYLKKFGIEAAMKKNKIRVVNDQHDAYTN